MSEQQPSPQAEQGQGNQNTYTLIFMVILSFSCALILSILASVLAEPKEIAKDLDRSKQMMIAAKILDYNGYFLLKDAEGQYIPAKYNKGGVLTKGSAKDIATNSQILDVYKRRIVPLLVNDKGDLTTFESSNINEDTYLGQYRKSGYYKEPLKLIYKVLPNSDVKKTQTSETSLMDLASEYVIPVNGFGLWDAIYGYLALRPDGDTVIGITWYDQKETPGLGANISEEPWQKLFPGKVIFQEGPDGKTDFKTAPLGITVVKGKVAEVLGNSPKAKSAVDGMAGATLTGNGVTEAYQHVLAAYRPFLVKLHEAYSATENNTKEKEG